MPMQGISCQSTKYKKSNQRKNPEIYLKAVKMMIALNIHLMTFAGTYF